MRTVLWLASFIIVTSCVSVKTHNARLERPVPAAQLKEDVDFAYRKLQQLHPHLYWYISKKDLDRKFDSLKADIKVPLKPNDFHKKLAPVIAEVRQGHLRLVAAGKRLSSDEIRNLKKQKGLLSRFNFYVDDGRIFVLDNRDSIANMQPGTEILRIHNIPVKTLLDRYAPLSSSDGYNTTFQKYMLARRWPSYFTAEYGLLDSVKIETRRDSAAHTFYLRRERVEPVKLKAETRENRKRTRSDSGKTKDYNIRTKSFNRDLRFISSDSAVAYMKIKTFSGTYSRRFYKQSFALLHASPAKILILDIRDNLGGSLSEINNLYSYLVDRDFEFIRDIEVTSRTSLFHADYFRTTPLLLKPAAVAVYPLYLLGTAFSVKKKDDHFYLRNNDLFALKKPKKDNFNGKIYVLINGSSFSASSILAAKLKAEKRAFLVGEETGGANDGTVAGRYATQKLPHSRLYLPIGLMLIRPSIEFTGTMKGVMPHHEIIPTTKQVLEKRDVQLNWILSELKKAGYF